MYHKYALTDSPRFLTFTSTSDERGEYLLNENNNKSSAIIYYANLSTRIFSDFNITVRFYLSPIIMEFGNFTLLNLQFSLRNSNI